MFSWLGRSLFLATLVYFGLQTTTQLQASNDSNLRTAVSKKKQLLAQAQIPGRTQPQPPTIQPPPTVQPPIIPPSRIIPLPPTVQPPPTVTPPPSIAPPTVQPSITPSPQVPRIVPDPPYWKPGSILQVDPILTRSELQGLSQIYLSQADRFLAQNQLYDACTALSKRHVSEFEDFLGKKLEPVTTDERRDCFSTVLQEISQRTESRTALVFPVILPDRLEILVILPKDRPGNANSKDRVLGKSKSPLNEMENSGRSFHRAVYEAAAPAIEPVISDFKTNLQDASSTDYLSQAQQLYNWIVRPIEPELKAARIETLVFVMDGSLRVVPPAALHDGKQFLVEKYASATVAALPLTKLDPRDRTKNLQILAMGLSEAMQGFAPLPAAALEVDTIATKVLRGDAFLNQSFTRNNLEVQRHKHDYGIIHLATHAEFVSQKPGDSFILLWNDKLRLHQIRSLQLGVEMLTLSACQTAVGQNLGLGGVAVESGAKSVLASLWPVSDLGTAPLMIRFYQDFQVAPSKAIALRNAQLSLIRGQVKIKDNKIQGIKGVLDIPLHSQGNISADLVHPFYWSSFILVGNWL